MLVTYIHINSAKTFPYVTPRFRLSREKIQILTLAFIKLLCDENILKRLWLVKHDQMVNRSANDVSFDDVTCRVDRELHIGDLSQLAGKLCRMKGNASDHQTTSAQAQRLKGGRKSKLLL